MEKEKEHIELQKTKLSDKDLLSIVHEDLKTSSMGKQEFESKIIRSKELYSGVIEEMPNENDRSEIIVKDALRQMSWAKSQISGPLMSESKPITIKPSSSENASIAEHSEELINFQFTTLMNRREFITAAVKQYIEECATIGRIYWKNKTKDVVIEEFDIPETDIVDFTLNGLADRPDVFIAETKDNGDGTVHMKLATTKLIDQRWDVEIIPFENFFPDPNATIIRPRGYDCDFVIERRWMTLSDIKRIGKDKGWKNISELEDKFEKHISLRSTGYVDNNDINNSFGFDLGVLRSYRETMLDKGYQYTAAKTKAGRDRIAVYIEYCLVDLEQNGKLSMTEIVFSGDTILYCEQSTYPDDSIPYVFCAFDKNNFSIYGTPFYEYMEDGMKVRSALMRGYIDSVAYSNYGLTFIKKHSLDNENVERARTRRPGDIIEVNGDPSSCIYEHTSASIPSQHWQMYDLWAVEMESSTGFQRLGQGQSSKYSTNTASGISMTIQAGQQRVNDYISWFSDNFIIPIIQQALLLNSEYLEEQTFVTIVGDKEMKLNKDNIDPNLNVSVSVNVTGQNDVRIQQIIQILGQATQLIQTGVTSPLILKKMFQKLLSAYNFKDIEYMIDSIDNTMPLGSKSMFELVKGAGEGQITDDEAMMIAEQEANEIMDKLAQIVSNVMQQNENEARIESGKKAYDEEVTDKMRKANLYAQQQSNREKAMQGSTYNAPLSATEISQKRMAQEVTR